MARLSRFLAPLMILAVLLSSAAVMLPAQQVFAAGPGEWDVNLDFTTSPNKVRRPCCSAPSSEAPLIPIRPVHRTSTHFASPAVSRFRLRIPQHAP